MSNVRAEIEDGIKSALEPLKSAGTIKWLESIGGQDYGTLLEAALGKAPFVVIKYIGKSGETQNGGLVRYTAELSLLIGAKSYKSLEAQRLTIYDILDQVENTLAGLRLTSEAGEEVYWGLDPVAEQWSELTGTGLEVWEQRYAIKWEEDYGRP